MSRTLAVTALSAFLSASAAFAQTPPVGMPAGTTATCGDGTFSSSASKKGACSGHKGVKEWYGAGPVKVWANKDTRVYHCPSDKFYGKTANGTYMSESDARAQGLKPEHGKSCQ
jgi:Protein of unknown function (DUF3761)